jgi:hypothetical protein
MLAVMDLQNSPTSSTGWYNFRVYPNSETGYGGDWMFVGVVVTVAQ